MINLGWLLVGTLVLWYVDKRAYREGMVDAIAMHNSGLLTYETYYDENGEEMIEMEIKPNE